MDEIKSVIQELPQQDIIILKTLYNPEVAKSQLSEDWQRVSNLLEWLSAEEQQEAVNVEAAEPEVQPEPEQPEAELAPEAEWQSEPNIPEWTTNVWSLEDYLI